MSDKEPMKPQPPKARPQPGRVLLWAALLGWALALAWVAGLAAGEVKDFYAWVLFMTFFTLGCFFAALFTAIDALFKKRRSQRLYLSWVLILCLTFFVLAVPNGFYPYLPKDHPARIMPKDRTHAPQIPVGGLP